MKARSLFKPLIFIAFFALLVLTFSLNTFNADTFMDKVFEPLEMEGVTNNVEQAEAKSSRPGCDTVLGYDTPATLNIAQLDTTYWHPDHAETGFWNYDNNNSWNGNAEREVVYVRYKVNYTGVKTQWGANALNLRFTVKAKFEKYENNQKNQKTTVKFWDESDTTLLNTQVVQNANVSSSNTAFNTVTYDANTQKVGYIEVYWTVLGNSLIRMYTPYISVSLITPDTTAPTISLTNPITSGYASYTNPLTLSNSLSISDNSQLASVTLNSYASEGSSSATTYNETTSYSSASTTFYLQKGYGQYTITATDIFGNPSSLTFYYISKYNQEQDSTTVDLSSSFSQSSFDGSKEYTIPLTISDPSVLGWSADGGAYMFNNMSFTDSQWSFEPVLTTASVSYGHAVVYYDIDLGSYVESLLAKGVQLEVYFEGTSGTGCTHVVGVFSKPTEFTVTNPERLFCMGRWSSSHGDYTIEGTTSPAVGHYGGQGQGMTYGTNNRFETYLGGRYMRIILGVYNGTALRKAYVTNPSLKIIPVDQTAPTIDYTPISSDSEWTTTPTITINESTTGIASYIYSANHFDGNAADSGKNTYLISNDFTTSVQIDCSTQARYTVTAKDFLGNSTTATINYWAPTFTLTIATDGAVGTTTGGQISTATTAQTTGSAYGTANVTSTNKIGDVIAFFSKPNNGYYYAGITKNNSNSIYANDFNTAITSTYDGASNYSGYVSTNNLEFLYAISLSKAPTKAVGNGEISLIAHFKSINEVRPTTETVLDYSNVAYPLTLNSSYSSAVVGETLTATPVYEKEVNGSYSAVSTIKDAGTYQYYGKITTQGGVLLGKTNVYALTLNALNVTFTANSFTITYGDAIPTLTYTTTGTIASQDNLGVSLSRESGENADTYTIEVNYTPNANYVVTTVPGTLTINKKALAVTISSESGWIYGEDKAITISYKGFVSGESASNLTTQAKVDFGASVNERGYLEVDTYTLANYVTYATSNNYEIHHTISESIVVTQRTLTLTYGGEQKTYDGNAPTPSKTAVSINDNAFAKNEDLEVLAFDYTLTVNNSSKNVDTYEIGATNLTTLKNYAVSFVNGFYVINKKALSISYVDEAITFGGTPTGTLSYSGFIASESNADLSTQPSVDFTTITAVTVIGENTYINAGSYTLTPAGATSINYDISYEEGTLAVSKRAVTVTLENKTSVYGETISVDSSAYSVTVGEVVSGDNLNLTISKKDDGKKVGDYDLTFTWNNDNYVVSGNTATYTITKADLTISYVSETITYGGTPAGEISYSGLQYGEAPSTALSPVPSIDFTTIAHTGNYVSAGTYTLSPKEVSAENYNLIYKSGELAVNKKQITVAYSEEITYGAIPSTDLTNKSLYTVSGLLSQDSLSVLTLSREEITNAGEYTLDSTNFSITADNYQLDYAGSSLSLVINKATLSVGVSFDKSSYVYSEVPVLTLTYSGFKWEEDESVFGGNLPTVTNSLNARGYVDVNNNYRITPAFDGELDNYKVELNSAYTAIAKATLTVTYLGKSVVYDGSYHSPTDESYSNVTIEGFVSGESKDGWAEGSEIKTGIEYAGISVSQQKNVYLNDNVLVYVKTTFKNYNVNSVGGTFEISQRVVTVTLDSQSSVYGEEITIDQTKWDTGSSEFVGSDTVNVEIVFTEGTPKDVGTYELGATCSVDDKNGGKNYSVSVGTGTYTITQREVVLNILSQSSVYTGSEPAISNEWFEVASTSTYDLVDGDDINLNITKVAGKDVGEYALNATYSNDNYSITINGATYTITKASLNVSIAFNHASVRQNGLEALGSNDFTITYSGFVAGEDENVSGVITTYCSVDLGAVKALEVGTHSIPYVECVALNYVVSYEVGQIIVAENLIVVTPTDYTFEDATYTYDGIKKHVDFVWDKPEYVTISYVYYYKGEEISEIKNVGVYLVQANFTTTDPLYTMADEFKSRSITLTIEKKAVTVTFSSEDLTKVYDGNVNIALPSQPTIVGMIYGEGMSFSLDASFNDKTAGEDKEITLLDTTPVPNEGTLLDNYDITVIASGLTATITKKDVSATYSFVSEKIYDGNLSVSAEFLSLQNMVDGDDLSATVSASYDDKNVGERSISVTITLVGADKDNYNLTNSSITENGKILAKEVTVLFAVSSKVYDGTDVASLSVQSIDGVLSGESISYENLSAKFDNVNVGVDKPVTIVSADAVPDAVTSLDNYQITISNALQLKANVTKRMVTISLRNQTSVYGEDYVISNSEYDVTSGEVVSGDGLNVIINRAGSSLNAGEYALTVDLTKINSNYSVSVVGAFYIITRAETIIYFDKMIKEIEYNGSEINVDTTRFYVYTNRENATADVTITADSVVKEVGEYTLTVTVSEQSGAVNNYLPKTETVVINVVRATPTIDFAPIGQTSYVYNGLPQTITGITHTNTDSDVVVSYSNNTFVDVPESGELTITVALSETQNYKAVSASYIVTILKGDYDLSAFSFENEEYNYNGEYHSLEVLGLPAGISVSYSYEDIAQAEPIEFKDAGIYIVKAIYSYDERNYNRPFLQETARLTIKRIDVTIEVTNQEGYYGEEPTFNKDGYNIIAGTFVAGDEIDLDLQLEPKDSYPIGNYQLVASATASGNYNVVVAKGVYKILPRPVTFRMEDKTSQYGDPDVALSYVLDESSPFSIVEGDTFVSALIRQEGNKPNESGYIIDGTIVNPNYAVTVIKGTYTIAPRAISIIVYDQEGTSPSHLSKKEYRVVRTKGSGTAVLRGDDLNVQVVAKDEIANTPGVYALTATYNQDLENLYEIKIVEATFTLRVSATISVSNRIDSKLYDGVPYTFDVKVSSGATPQITLNGIYVENSFTEIGIYEITIFAPTFGDYAEPDPYSFIFEIKPTSLKVEEGGAIFVVEKEDGFGADEVLVARKNNDIVLSGEDFTSKINSAYSIYIQKGDEEIALNEYQGSEGITLKVKINDELQNLGVRTWFMNEKENVFNTTDNVDEEGFMIVSVQEGSSVAFVTERQEATPLIIASCALGLAFLILFFFYLFRRKAI